MYIFLKNWQKSYSYPWYIKYINRQYLFQNEHSVVEELLQFFIGVIDAQLFKGVHLK